MIVVFGGLIIFLISGSSLLSSDETVNTENKVRPRSQTQVRAIRPQTSARPDRSSRRSKNEGFEEDIAGLKQKTLEAITHNTMGPYDLPDPIKKIVMAEIDSVSLAMMEGIYRTYSKHAIDIPKADTIKDKNIELYKILR